mmetsp:Transcript_42483/g.134024  ORF Transcript_42483/g.134024 Transcript_42483/m.134024 type:complete len:250 (-) Transcript_42483:85-834(-)
MICSAARPSRCVPGSRSPQRSPRSWGSETSSSGRPATDAVACTLYSLRLLLDAGSTTARVSARTAPPCSRRKREEGLSASACSSAATRTATASPRASASSGSSAGSTPSLSSRWERSGAACLLAAERRRSASSAVCLGVEGERRGRSADPSPSLTSVRAALSLAAALSAARSIAGASAPAARPISTRAVAAASLPSSAATVAWSAAGSTSAAPLSAALLSLTAFSIAAITTSRRSSSAFRCSPSRSSTA